MQLRLHQAGTTRKWQHTMADKWMTATRCTQQNDAGRSAPFLASGQTISAANMIPAFNQLTASSAASYDSYGPVRLSRGMIWVGENLGTQSLMLFSIGE